MVKIIVLISFVQNHCILLIFSVCVTWKSGMTYWWLEKSQCHTVSLPKPISFKLEECGVGVGVCMSAGRLISFAFYSMSQTFLFCQWKAENGLELSSVLLYSPTKTTKTNNKKSSQNWLRDWWANRQRYREREWWIRDGMRGRKRKKAKLWGWVSKAVGEVEERSVEFWCPQAKLRVTLLTLEL